MEFVEKPVEVREIEIASKRQKGAYSFAPMLALLIVLMCLTGAFYPAVDLAAGEKERGTMETLLVTPARRSEIVLGKFIAIWIVGLGLGGVLGEVDWGLIGDKAWFALPRLFPFGGPGFGWKLGLAASRGAPEGSKSFPNEGRSARNEHPGGVQGAKTFPISRKGAQKRHRFRGSATECRFFTKALNPVTR